jgi:Asp-tRNA(Asn)/Glu-tRNA(Gln) amidotransferase A subunit family amidase
MTPARTNPTRRELLAAAAALGIGSPTFQRAVAAEATAQPGGVVTAEMVKNAEWVAGITLTDDQRQQVATSMTSTVGAVAGLHKIEVGNAVGPAVHFIPNPGEPPAKIGPRRPVPEPVPAPVFGPPVGLDDDEIAFLPLSKLAPLVRTRKVTSTDLTKLYLERLKKYDPALKCVVTLTEDLALKQAAEADKEIAARKYRGPLHGIPWGAKDLVAYPGYVTTWGAAKYKDRVIDVKATVAERLDEAGAVLAAKTTLGTLALGDVWFGGTTRNPWNVKQGSSGSSAGSASSVAAGLVGFAIGSETNGSIISPCTRCGATGLRPTFGRVSRHGCMTLCWSMDKIGPIARSVEDCALIFAAIQGSDGKDATVQDRPFEWPCRKAMKDIRVGYVEGKGADDRADLKVLKEFGVTLVPITLPSGPAAQINSMTINVESAAAFDELGRANDLDEIGTFWPRTFRSGRFVTAVDYLRTQRVRTLLMQQMAKMMEQVDLYVGVFDLSLTNITGHPSVVLPNGFTKAGNAEVPASLTFTGRLWGESELLHVAKAYQEATGHHLKHPDMTKVTKENAGQE